MISHTASTHSTALPALGHAIAGSTGTAISNLATYPLSLIITRLQTQRLSGRPKKGQYTNPTLDHYDGILDAAQKIYDRDGIAGFFTGVGPDTAKSVADSFLFFLFYNYMRTNRVTRRKAEGHGGALPTWDELSIGMAAGGLSKLFTTPLSNITTRAQTTSRHQSMAQIASQIQKEKGLIGFWSGYSASLILTLNPALTFTFYEALKRLLPKSTRDDPGARVTFLIAALSKAMASSITYPFSLAKARAQASSEPPVPNTPQQMKENAKSEYNTARQSTTAARQVGRKEAHRAADSTVFSSIMRIAQEEGIAALYVGLGGEVLKGFFSHGITMLVKEQVHDWVIRLYFYLQDAYRRINPAKEAEKVKGQARGTYERMSEDAQRQAGNLASSAQDTAQSAGSTISEKVQGVSQSIQDTAAQAKEKVLDVVNGTTHGQPGKVVEPTYGAIPVPARNHSSTSTGGPGAKAHSVYDGAVGTGTGVKRGGETKSITAGKTHSVYDQAVKETRNQDLVINNSEPAAPMGQRTFPKGSDANLKIDKEQVRRDVGREAGPSSNTSAEGVAYMRDNGAKKLTGHGDVGNIPEMDAKREKKGAGN